MLGWGRVRKREESTLSSQILAVYGDGKYEEGGSEPSALAPAP